jgi:hypothetical protein
VLWPILCVCWITASVITGPIIYKECLVNHTPWHHMKLEWYRTHNIKPQIHTLELNGRYLVCSKVSDVSKVRGCRNEHFTKTTHVVFLVVAQFAGRFLGKWVITTPTCTRRTRNSDSPLLFQSGTPIWSSGKAENWFTRPVFSDDGIPEIFRNKVPYLHHISHR